MSGVAPGELAPHAPLPGRARRAAHLAVAAGSVVGLLASKVPLCPMAAGAGVPCPACGMTRASLAALRGELAQAFALHPLVFVALPVLAVVLWSTGRNYLERGRMQLGPSLSRRMGSFFLVLYLAMIALWLLRFAGAFGGPVPVERVWGG